jgi:Pimeloyl-CoA synthetase
MSDKVNIDQIAADILAQVPELADPQDAAAFLAEVKSDLQDYSDQLSRGELSKDEFEYNVKGLVELGLAHSIKDQELHAVKIDKIKEMITQLLVQAISAAAAKL